VVEQKRTGSGSARVRDAFPSSRHDLHAHLPDGSWSLTVIAVERDRVSDVSD
jgi:hypothetical protein